MSELLNPTIDTTECPFTQDLVLPEKLFVWEFSDGTHVYAGFDDVAFIQANTVEELPLYLPHGHRVLSAVPKRVSLDEALGFAVAEHRTPHDTRPVLGVYIESTDRKVYVK